MTIVHIIFIAILYNVLSKVPLHIYSNGKMQKVMRLIITLVLLQYSQFVAAVANIDI